MKEKKYKNIYQDNEHRNRRRIYINGRYLMLIHILLNMVIVIHAMYR